MEAFSSRTIDDMPSIHDGLVKLAGAELGVESFGLQVLDLPPGFAHYPEHDHAEDGQEEVYVVLRGAAEMTVDGECVPISAGATVRVAPEARRSIAPGADGARILAIGRSRTGAYERPTGFRLAEARA